MRQGSLIYLIIGIMCLFAAIILLSLMGTILAFLSDAALFSKANPLAVFAIFLVVVFAGTYFFRAAGHMIKETVK